MIELYCSYRPLFIPLLLVEFKLLRLKREETYHAKESHKSMPIDMNIVCLATERKKKKRLV